jgi:outer membrane protein assembly factor BamA
LKIKAESFIFVAMQIPKPYESFAWKLLFVSYKRKRSASPAFLCGILLFFLFSSSIRVLSQPNARLDHNPNTGTITCDTITTPYVILQEIIIQGNAITKEKIILREIGYKEGDTIPANILSTQLLWIKNRIFNTTLFLWVDLDLTGNDSYYKTLSIGLRERFFLTILPTGGLADRNFNEWWQTRHHNLNRIYYGINLKVKNIFGLNHTLKVVTNLGFNQKIETNYIIPYITRKLKTGLTINALLVHNRQVAFRTYHHKLDYFEDPSFGRRRYRVEDIFTYRKKFYIQHQVGPYFQYTVITDTIASLNPKYFLDGGTYQRSIGLKYSYSHDKRDFINYPLKGYILRIDTDFQRLISRTTLNVASLRAEYTHFIPLRKNLYFATSIRGKISSPFQQPYFSQRGLGYNNDFVSGYELYVVDGQWYGLIKNNLRYRILSINPTVKAVPLRKFRTIPLSIYFKIYSDAGYVVDNTYNPYNNFLSNRLLVGGGAGIDIVTYYDIVGRIEYSVNQLGQTGIYLHVKAGL